MGFKGGLPVEIEALCAKCPQLFDLIVQPAKVTETRALLAVKGTAIHQAMMAVEEFLKKKDGE